MKYHTDLNYVEDNRDYNLEISIDSDTKEGHFEHYAINGNYHVEGILEFNEDFELDGYDGTYELDEVILDIIENWGIKINL